jgi:hypothetical protein
VHANDVDRKADLSAAQKSKVPNGDESSDQKLIHGLSGKGDTDETDHFGSIINNPGGENDLSDFAKFMNGISSDLKVKEDKKKLKL